MKILQVITRSELGGAQSIVANLANYLCKNNEVIVVAGEGDGKMWKSLDENIQKIRCPYLQRSLSPWNDIRTLFFLKKIYRTYMPDIIHLHSSKAGLLGRLAFPKKKIIYTVHGFDSIRIAFRKLLPIEKFIQRRCMNIIGVSYYDTKNLRSECITQGLSTIYNGIQPPETTIKRTLEVPNHFKKRILCIARVAKPKRVDIFIDVAKQLPDYAFVWIGNQENMECDIPNVFFMGNIINAGEYNTDTDLFMLPSDYEGLPIVIIEAMSFGKPIVASNVGGVSEIVRNGQNGYTAENTIEDFTEKIRNILTNETLYQKMSEKSLEIFKNELTAEKMVTEYLKLYQKIYKSNKHE